MRDLNPADFESGALFPLVEVGGSLEVSFQCLGEMKSVGIFSLGGLGDKGDTGPALMGRERPLPRAVRGGEWGEQRRGAG